VPLNEPRWWYSNRWSLVPRLLNPVARVVGWSTARRWRRSDGYRATLPVVCVGNFTAGGTGKTPLALNIAECLRELGEKPVFLTRGYGGTAHGPRRVDADHDSATLVGDEAILLARTAPTFVARNRAGGAQAIEHAIAARDCSATILIMDDGLQNPQLHKDLTIAVVDGVRGLGNGHVLPAGPLRAPLEFQRHQPPARF
jgi:tetraacyldisaccharide 4'-kinase